MSRCDCGDASDRIISLTSRAQTGQISLAARLTLTNAIRKRHARPTARTAEISARSATSRSRALWAIADALSLRRASACHIASISRTRRGIGRRRVTSGITRSHPRAQVSLLLPTTQNDASICPAAFTGAQANLSKLEYPIIGPQYALERQQAHWSETLRIPVR